MSQLTERLQGLKANNRKGLIVYLTAGYPDFATTLEAAEAMVEEGVDVIEIGIPFSDPIADGPVIQKAANLALKAGATTAKSIELIRQIREKSNVPLVVMTYINSILRYGVEEFIGSFAKAGMNGIIVPDLPMEESELLADICHKNGIDLIQFIAPTTTVERITNICKKASGFVYCISSTGVTGVRNLDYTQIGEAMDIARQMTDIPLAIGFGIGTPEAACEAAEHADAVIVGSALIDRLTNEGVDGARNLIREMRSKLDKESVCGENISRAD